MNRQRRLEAAVRAFGRDAAQAGLDLRTARLAAGLTLDEVAAAVGTSRSTVLRAELAAQGRHWAELLARHAAAVGLRPRLRLYPDGPAMRDAGQTGLMIRFRGRIGDVGRWATEVPVPIPGDPGAIDAVLTLERCRCGIEFIMRLHDCQAQLRPIHLKQRDAQLDRMIVVVSATHANRRAIREAGAYLAEAFPLGTRRILSALAAGRDPGGNGRVLL